MTLPTLSLGVVSFGRKLIKALAIGFQYGGMAGEFLPTPDDDIAVFWIEFDHPALPVEFFAGD